MQRIVNCAAKEHFHLWLRFDDDREGVVDLGELVGKCVFKAWEDESIFKQVKIDPVAKTVFWLNGQVDLDPDVLYEHILKKST